MKVLFALLLLPVLQIPAPTAGSRTSLFHGKFRDSFQKRAPSCLSGNGNDNAVALFIFGDSYFDPGNNNYINTTTLDQANFWPYGESYFTFPTGRFSNGRLISDFVAEHAKLPLIPPFLQPGYQEYRHGVNFASAGAGALAETFRGSVIDLSTQLLYYTKVEARLRQEYGDVESNIIISNAVYLFSIGTNDYLRLFLSNSTMLHSYSSPSNYIKMVIGNLNTVVRAIYERGGRKFGFLNLGDLGCLPGLRMLQSQSHNGGCLEQASRLAKLHNSALYNFLSEMKHQLQGFKYSLWDFNTALKQRMNHPSNFGLEEGIEACCGAGPLNGIFSCGGMRPMVAKEFELCENPRKYVFWDSYHLTESVYRQMATEMWSGPPTEKRDYYDLKALFQC